jgi:predicted patatin/cPLA2 family phospholipase
MLSVDLKRLSYALAVLAAQIVHSGCASIERLPAVPLALASSIHPLNIPYARFYAVGDEAPIEAMALEMGLKERKALGLSADKDLPTNYFLAISGGGDDGAFGAGLLKGWTERGDRPKFRIVTGISTGALSAPFAFLGSDYDDELMAVYTQVSAEDIFEKRGVVSALTGDAVTDSTPLRNLIARHVTKDMVRRIAEEYDKGRVLLIATTNLDQARSVIWNIGAIAKSSDPRARELIIEVLRASASIPGVFPPVMLDVTVDGKRYEEMHVDGGAVAQAFLYPPSISLKKIAAKRGITRKNVAYIIRNGRMFRPEEDVKRETLAIAGQAISTMITSAGVNDAYRIYLTTQRDGVGYNLAMIGDDFVLPYKGPFDRDYMKAMFEYGFEKGKAGYNWMKKPPGYQE